MCGRPNEKYNLPGCPYPTTSLFLFIPPSTSCPGLGVGAGCQPPLPTASDQLRTLYQQARGDELGPPLRAPCPLPCIVPTPSRLAPLPPRGACFHFAGNLRGGARRAGHRGPACAHHRTTRTPNTAYTRLRFFDHDALLVPGLDDDVRGLCGTAITSDHQHSYDGKAENTGVDHYAWIWDIMSIGRDFRANSQIQKIFKNDICSLHIFEQKRARRRPRNLLARDRKRQKQTK